MTVNKCNENYFKRKSIFFSNFPCQYSEYYYFCRGELAEWSIAAVLKTVVPRGTGGSNPSLSAESCKSPVLSGLSHF